MHQSLHIKTLYSRVVVGCAHSAWDSLFNVRSHYGWAVQFYHAVPFADNTSGSYW